MNKVFFQVVVVAMVFFFGQKLSAQETKNGTPIYITTKLSDYAPKSKVRFSKPDIKKIKVIYHHEIDPNNTGRVDYDLVKRTIIEKIPNSRETGYCVLDWEGPQFEYLKFGKIDKDSMGAIIRKFSELLTFARKMRPRMEWGIYDMPVTTYWVNQDTTWPQRSAIIEPLIKECDILCPTLYDYFQTGSYGWMDDSAYLRVNTQHALTFGVKYNKPVLPFMWHRYHDATEKVGLLCISPDEFYGQVQLINKTRVQGKGISGMIWWHEDQYYYGIKDPRIMGEAKGRNRDEYLDDIALEYLDIMLRALQ